MKICLYGSGSRKTEEIYIAETYRLGAEMAKRGHTLVFGGGVPEEFMMQEANQLE